MHTLESSCLRLPLGWLCHVNTTLANTSREGCVMLLNIFIFLYISLIRVDHHRHLGRLRVYLRILMISKPASSALFSSLGFLASLSDKALPIALERLRKGRCTSSSMSILVTQGISNGRATTSLGSCKVCSCSSLLWTWATLMPNLVVSLWVGYSKDLWIGDYWRSRSWYHVRSLTFLKLSTVWLLLYSSTALLKVRFIDLDLFSSISAPIVRIGCRSAIEHENLGHFLSFHELPVFFGWIYKHAWLVAEIEWLSIYGTLSLRMLNVV